MDITDTYKQINTLMDITDTYKQMNTLMNITYTYKQMNNLEITNAYENKHLEGHYRYI